MLALFLAAPRALFAADLYWTDFDSFPVGPDAWVGNDGWLGNNTGAKVHGIDQDIIQGLGNTAYLGYYQPPSTFTTVFRPVSYDPVAANTPLVEFETLMGIQDSSNGRGDIFYFTFYNLTGYPLAAIVFNNTNQSSGILRSDGASQHPTGLGFYPGQLHLLYCAVDFSANRWSADLDGIPLFANAVFNASGRELDLYGVAAEWQIAAGSTNLYGDNWMLVADWIIRAIPEGQAPFVIEAISRATNGSPVISWLGEPGFTYELRATADLTNWQAASTCAAFSNLTASQTLFCTNGIVPDLTNRFYRLFRSVTP